MTEVTQYQRVVRTFDEGSRYGKVTKCEDVTDEIRGLRERVLFLESQVSVLKADRRAA